MSSVSAGLSATVLLVLLLLLLTAAVREDGWMCFTERQRRGCFSERKPKTIIQEEGKSDMSHLRKETFPKWTNETKRTPNPKEKNLLLNIGSSRESGGEVVSFHVNHQHQDIRSHDSAESSADKRHELIQKLHPFIFTL